MHVLNRGRRGWLGSGGGPPRGDRPPRARAGLPQGRPRRVHLLGRPHERGHAGGRGRPRGPARLRPRPLARLAGGGRGAPARARGAGAVARHRPRDGSVAVSPGGAADVLVHALEFLGVAGEFGAAGLVAARPMGAWTPQQRLGSAIGLQLGGQYHADLAAGSAGDALYVDGERSDFAPTMRFSARRRAVDGTLYGERSTLHAGAQGEIRAAQSTPRRFLVLMRSGGGLRSRAGSPATGFEAPLVFSATNASRLLGLAGARSGLAVAAWVTTSGRLQAAIYDDSLGPASLPPVAALDTVAPVLSRLSLWPRRFAVRRRSPRSAAARGTRIRWRLSEPARVTLRVDRVRLGFRRGERCVARRPRTGGVRRCKRFSRVGSFARTAQAGRTAVRFNGRVRRRALRLGRYRLTAIARDAMGNRSRARRAPIQVVRAPLKASGISAARWRRGRARADGRRAGPSARRGSARPRTGSARRPYCGARRGCRGSRAGARAARAR